jgi:hypothetical protein
VVAGYDVAVIVAQPGARSQQNAHGRGFDLLYARAILVKHSKNCRRVTLTLWERLDQEIIPFNVAATGYHDARLLSIAACGDRETCARGCPGGWAGAATSSYWGSATTSADGLGARLLVGAAAPCCRPRLARLWPFV